jgi:drug/metabolite transporter (DMT)-like permease
MDKRILGAFGFAVVAWASAFPAIRIALAAYSPSQLAFFRFSIAALVLLGIGAAARFRLPPWRDLLRMAVLGVVGVAVYAVALGFGQKQVPAGSASLLISSAPVWMVVIAAALGQERPTIGAMLGIGVSFSGVALIAAGRGIAFASGPHALAVLAAAIAAAVYNILQRPLVAKYGALRFTIAAVWGGAIALAPAVAGLPAAVQAAPASATIAIVYLAIVPGALGYAAWSHAAARASAAAAGSALYLVPAVSMALSNLLLGEVPSGAALVGGTLVLAGVAAVHGARKQPSSQAAVVVVQGRFPSTRPNGEVRGGVRGVA